MSCHKRTIISESESESDCMLCVILLKDLFVFLCCVFESVCELFGETIRNIFRCGCYFAVEFYGSVLCGGGALLDIPRMVFQRLCILYL